MKRSSGASKVAHIKSGAVQKKQLGGSTNQKVVPHKDGKYAMKEIQKKSEEAKVSKKNRNDVMQKAKLGTEKEQNFKKIQEAIKPRNNEIIYQTKKKVEYLDNYQYHETKDIKNLDPSKVSVVRHRRKGDIGGTYEETTFQQRTMTNPGKGSKLYSSQTTKTTTTTTTRRSEPVGPKLNKPAQRTNTASRSLPSASQEYRKEVKKFSSYSNLRGAGKNQAKPAEPNRNRAAATKTTTKTTIKTTTKTTKTASSSNRAQSAGRGRRH